MATEFLIEHEDQLIRVAGFVCDHFDQSKKPLKVKITQAGKRSLDQNALMWMWLGELVEQIKRKSGESYSTDDLHEYFKSRFCPAKELRFGEKVINATSTTRLDPGEMHFYLNQIHEWSIDAGFRLTLPMDCEYRELQEKQNG